MIVLLLLYVYFFGFLKDGNVSSKLDVWKVFSQG